MRLMIPTLVVFAFVRSAFAVSAFQLPVMNGESGEIFKSADHQNAVFVVENFFQGCPYCHDNAPQVDKLALEFESNERVKVLDVGIDTSDSLYRQWIAEESPNHPVLKDASRTLTGQLGTTGYPSTYVLDCKLNVRMKTSGVWSSSTAAKIRSTINQALTENCAQD